MKLKKSNLFWIISLVVIIVLISACTSPTKIEEKDNDFSCGDPVEFTYKGERVVYGSVFGQNETCWLDRNLGAFQVCQATDDKDCYGDLFQWGRGDDGHQDRNSKTTNNLSSSDEPGHNEFIINHFLSPWDWGLSQNDNLWQGVKGINNPCPYGWRVPTELELKDEMNNWITDDSLGAFSSSLKWPAAGHRLTFGKVQLVGLGYVWSSTTASSYSQYLIFSTSGGAGVGHYARVHGLSVRCILD